MSELPRTGAAFFAGLSGAHLKPYPYRCCRECSDLFNPRHRRYDRRGHPVGIGNPWVDCSVECADNRSKRRNRIAKAERRGSS